MAEFGVLLGLVAVVAVAATSTVGTKVREIFGGTANIIDLASNGLLQSSRPLLLSGGVSSPLPPTILTSSLSGASYGAAYSQILSASSQDSDPVSWSLASGALPSGMNLNAATGAIAGASTEVGTAAFSVRATDGVNGLSSTAALSIAVIALPPTISTSSLPSGTTAIAYSKSLAASDPQSLPLSWSVSSGTLPAGLGLSSAGLLSGTPAAAGTYAFTVRAADAAGAAATQALSLSVALPSPPAIATTSLPGVLVGGSYAATLSATDPQSLSVSWSLSAGTLPSGVTLGPAGVLSGAASATGTWNFTISAVDAAGASSSRALSIIVAPAPSCSGADYVYARSCLFLSGGTVASAVAGVQVRVVAIGGGGGGAGNQGGGGGSGYVAAASVTIPSTSPVTATVGGGGGGGGGGSAATPGQGGDGSASSFGSLLTAAGGHAAPGGVFGQYYGGAGGSGGGATQSDGGANGGSGGSIGAQPGGTGQGAFVNSASNVLGVVLSSTGGSGFAAGAAGIGNGRYGGGGGGGLAINGLASSGGAGGNWGGHPGGGGQGYGAGGGAGDQGFMGGGSGANGFIYVEW